MLNSINLIFTVTTILVVLNTPTNQSTICSISTPSIFNLTDSSSEETSGTCGDIQYENRNAFEVETLRLRMIKGVAKDRYGRPIPDVCVGVFSEESHQLIVATKTDNKGKFEFKGIPSGCYRLVGKLAPFLVANSRIQITANAPRKKLLLLLVLNEIDACSSFELK